MPANNNDRLAFESAIQALHATLANAGTHLVIDSIVRQAYVRQIAAMSHDSRFQVQRGKLTWKQAAVQAQETRNVIMEILRSKSTPVGRAGAEKMKRHGKTLNGLIAEKTLEQFGQNANFHNLTPAQHNTVYAEIVKSAGKDRPSVSAMMGKLSHAGRGLVVLSIAISAYSIATADDKVRRQNVSLRLPAQGSRMALQGVPWRD